MPQKRPRRSTTARGYGTRHQKLRRELAAFVRSGGATCAKCGGPIDPSEPWDLDHTDDRRGYNGPAHRACNRATARPQKRITSREW